MVPRLHFLEADHPVQEGPLFSITTHFCFKTIHAFAYLCSTEGAKTILKQRNKVEISHFLISTYYKATIITSVVLE